MLICFVLCAVYTVLYAKVSRSHVCTLCSIYCVNLVLCAVCTMLNFDTLTFVLCAVYTMLNLSLYKSCSPFISGVVFSDYVDSPDIVLECDISGDRLAWVVQ